MKGWASELSLAQAAEPQGAGKSQRDTQVPTSEGQWTKDSDDLKPQLGKCGCK